MIRSGNRGIDRTTIRRSRALYVLPFLMIFVVFVLCLSTYGYVTYGNHIPGPLNGDCDVCHLPGDFTSFNPYGLDFLAVATHTSDAEGAIAEIADLDSDGDGYLNNVELENETNPGDDTDFPTGTPKTPRLEITNFTKSSRYPIEGEKLVLYGNILNSGDGTANNVTVKLYHEDALVDQILTGITIADNDTQYVVFTLYPEAGNHKFTLEVDYIGGKVTYDLYVHISEKSTNFPSVGLISLFSVIGLVAFGFGWSIYRKD